jgi:hypothetical protein
VSKGHRRVKARRADPATEGAQLQRKEEEAQRRRMLKFKRGSLYFLFTYDLMITLPSASSC